MKRPPFEETWQAIGASPLFALTLTLLAYLVGIFLMILGTEWLASGRLPVAAGLWWLLLPMLALGVWLYLRDGRVAKSWWQR